MKGHRDPDLSKHNILRATKYSRRQVLKGIAIAGAGVVIANLPASCKSSSTTQATDSQPTTSDSTNPTSGSTNPNLPFTYTPAKSSPPLITIADTSCTVATDRLYSEDHVWVLTLSNNRAVMGITQTLYEIIYRPYRVETSDVGTVLSKGDTFSTMEGYKMTVEVVSPVSGTIVDMNRLAVGSMGEDGAIQALTDSYKTGWMVVVQLSKPSELNNLLSPQDYIKSVKS